MRSQLIERGRRYVELVDSPVLQEYTAKGVYREVTTETSEKLFTVTGRIMLDPTTFRSKNPNAYELLMPWVKSRDVIVKYAMVNDDLLLCCHRIQGFAFAQKEWGSFAVSKMNLVVWNESAIERLILEERKAKIISMLIQSHGKNDTLFDDIVNGKGKGLVGLFSGSPGVGKTLTAEVVAELSHQPLYVISAGEMGTAVDKVDHQLGMVLDITRRWGCVLLIDEADVFLHKRTDSQLGRNALVSIFLRRLEYFQGIVILTTNRRDDMDEAFESRIHFQFHYPPLDEKGRLRVWKDFLGGVCKQLGCPALHDDELKSLAKRSMNGREIKNAVCCVASIVRANNEPLTATLVTDLLESLTDKSYQSV